MKILEITRSFYPSIGGMEKFVADRLKIYEKLNIDYQVITTTHTEKKINLEKSDNVIYLHSYTPYEIVPGLEKTMKIDYDILSVNQLNYCYSVQAVNSAWKKGKKIILTPHFHFHTDRFQFVKTFHNNYFLPKILEKVNKVVCFTDYEANYWRNKFPEVGNKISVIPHYFDKPEQKKIYTKNDFGNFFLFLGRGEKNKRIDLLIKAFTNLNNDYNLVLTLHEDEIQKELKSIISQDNRIHLLGRVPEDEKQSLLANCLALILPTDFEAFGIVNFEASLYKKPLILTELSIFKNILSNEGVIYFQNNLSSIENAIRKFIALSKNEIEKMGDRNFKNLEKYSFEKITQKYLEILNELRV